MEKAISKLKTHGELHGEQVDIFSLKELEMEKENVESKWLHPSQLHDESRNIIINNY